MVFISDAIAIFVGVAVISATLISIIFAIFAIVLSRNMTNKPGGYLDLRLTIKYDFARTALFTIVPPITAAIVITLMNQYFEAILETIYFLIYFAEGVVLVLMVIGVWRTVNKAYYSTLENEMAPTELKCILDEAQFSEGVLVTLPKREFNVETVVKKLYSQAECFESAVRNFVKEKPDFFDDLNYKMENKKFKKLFKPKVQAPYQVAMICIDAICNNSGTDANENLNYAIAVASTHRNYVEPRQSKKGITNHIVKRKSYPSLGESLMRTVHSILLCEKYNLQTSGTKNEALKEYAQKLLEEALKQNKGNKIAKHNLLVLSNMNNIQNTPQSKV